MSRRHLRGRMPPKSLVRLSMILTRPIPKHPRWFGYIGSSDASEFFQIPTGRVVEVGTQVMV